MYSSKVAQEQSLNFVTYALARASVRSPLTLGAAATKTFKRGINLICFDGHLRQALAEVQSLVENVWLRANATLLRFGNPSGPSDLLSHCSRSQINACRRKSMTGINWWYVNSSLMTLFVASRPLVLTTQLCACPHDQLPRRALHHSALK